MKYEYNAINNPTPLGDRTLNRLGEEGWELVSHAYDSISFTHYYTFKRMKIETEFKTENLPVSGPDMTKYEVPFYYAVDEIVENNDWVGVDENRNPMYRYKGIYYTLDKNFQQILEERVERTPHWWWDALEPRDVPVSSWMDEYKKDYQALVTSGMFWEFHPTWTGEWEKDKFAFCYDKKKKK